MTCTTQKLSFALKYGEGVDHSVGSAATSGTNPTIISKQNGFLSYSEICLNVLNGWQEVNDSFTKSPYAFFESQWVGYDNPWSVGIKSNFINELGLGGAAVWSLENDDFLNLCGNGKSPLTNTIKQVLGAVVEGNYLILFEFFLNESK
ncbi:hypothetical protein QYM36_001507 [Artemia franciscana]|uniref:GH18 domain-containing protein n=1 Tax=Artemia franciscana TaxID=6661 RepID=A0AA88IAU6_ARTSF|nr:hypothetical protein QYM36_001507 [Artemia franciscana]